MGEAFSPKFHLLSHLRLDTQQQMTLLCGGRAAEAPLFQETEGAIAALCRKVAAFLGRKGSPRRHDLYTL